MTDHQDKFQSLLTDAQTDLDALLEPGETLQGAIDRLFQPPQKGDRHLTPHDLGLDGWQLELRNDWATRRFIEAEQADRLYRECKDEQLSGMFRNLAKRRRKIAIQTAQSVYDLLRDLEG